MGQNKLTIRKRTIGLIVFGVLTVLIVGIFAAVAALQWWVATARTDRPELAKAIRRLDAGDVLVVTRLDRLARSTRDLLNILDAIAKAGAGFKSLKDTWADNDPSRPSDADRARRSCRVRARTNPGSY